MKFFKYTQFFVYIIFLISIFYQSYGFFILYSGGTDDFAYFVSFVIAMLCMIFTPFIFLYHFFINKLPNKSKICNITKNIYIINICMNLNYLLSNIIGAIIIDFYNNTKAFYLNFLVYIFFNIIFFILCIPNFL